MFGFGLSSAVFACSFFVDASKSRSNGFTSGMLGVDVCGARYAGSASSSRSTRTTIMGGCGKKSQHQKPEKRLKIYKKYS
jgi:hypothetical protein